MGERHACDRCLGLFLHEDLVPLTGRGQLFCSRCDAEGEMEATIARLQSLIEELREERDRLVDALMACGRSKRALYREIDRLRL